VRWQPSLGGTLSLGRTNSFFLGGGRAMLNALYLTAEKLGVEILYDAEVLDLEIEDGMFLSATLKQPIGASESAPRRWSPPPAASRPTSNG
jgi:tricarballylate dehydrogenase